MALTTDQIARMTQAGMSEPHHLARLEQQLGSGGATWGKYSDALAAPLAKAEPAPAPTPALSPSSASAPTLADVEPYEYTPYELKPPEITPKPAPEYKAPDPYAPGTEATVEGRMTGLLSSGSPYIQSAQQRAREYAASRGLLNTTMAATAGERAAIESALPIAQQDAGAFQEAGILGYQGEIAGATATQKHGQDINLVGEQAKYSSLLSGQTAEQEAVAADKLDVAKKELLAMGGEIDAATAAKLADVNATAAERLAAVQEETARRLAETDAETAARLAETDAETARRQQKPMLRRQQDWQKPKKRRQRG